MKVKVKKLFMDVQAGVDRLPGETFECATERANEIVEKLGTEYVELVKATRKKKTEEE